MKRFRPRGVTVVATLFVVVGLGLMVASLQIESNRAPEAAAPIDVVVPTVSAARATATAEPSDPDATRLFARVQEANRTLSYGGVKKVARWTNGKESTAVVTVEHVPGEGTTIKEGEGDAASPAMVTVEPAGYDDAIMFAALVSNYRLTSSTTTPVLGRDATLLEAHRADGSLAARFWVDDDTALVLRRDLVSASGATVESTSYVKVDFTPRTPRATASPTATDAPTTAPATAAWSLLGDNKLDALRAEGWLIPASLDDGLTLYQARQQEQADGTTLQLTYTDGLLGVSVFLQQGALDRAAMTGFTPVTVAGGEVWSRNNAQFFTWQSRPATFVGAGADAKNSARDIVVSALADSPDAPIGAVLVAFAPLPAEEAGVGEHLTRGVQRVGSWIDPLG